ncbi:electron transport complex subunit RsxC [Halothiobacillus sp.]|uniref:electron transport complex subunit RsxC n=1 Tax=Halothiobacillus sp. TaxID=1891311 RepID=UPI00260F2B76|nr:electron transport complex subunit RsxC [Halothiobacillus sp.]MDD4966881.1 electron transport complex subunit RsxC [Halothiobacillus sp.]
MSDQPLQPIAAPFSFHGGIHPPENKTQTRDRPIKAMPLQSRYVLPLQMHIGAAAQAVVKVGDRVGKGQVLAQATDFVSASVHAPTSGTIVDISSHPIAHPGGLSAPSILLQADGEDRWAERMTPWVDYQDISPAQLRGRLREAGIVGLGGAVFPTAAKMATGQSRVPTLILNGAECEPYITCDDRLMREQPEDILRGAAIAMYMIGAERCLIGIEDNKPEAIAALLEASRSDPRFAVFSVPTRYPAGGEKQLIKVLTNIEVPRGRRASEFGLLCLNVATVVAVHRAVTFGEPMIDRIVTVTGEGITQPENLKVRIGTLMSDVVAEAGGYRSGVDRLIMGGPMMGFALHSDEVPVVKATNCLLALRPQDRPAEPAPQPCIRCSLCAEACPADLLPQQLYWYARAKQFDRVVEYNLFDCIECGVCSAVCPSHLPLVDYYRFAKTEVWAQEREKSKANQARERFEFRNERLERIKAEREAALNKKRQALAAKTAATPDDASAAPAHSDAFGTHKPASNGTEAPASMDAAVEAARARAKARREALDADRAAANEQTPVQAQQEQISKSDRP